MLLWMDGMAHYATPQLPKKWTTVIDPPGLPGAFTIQPLGRFGNCIQFLVPGGSSSNSGQLSISPLVTQAGGWTPTASGVCGFAIKVSDLQRVGTGSPVAYLWAVGSLGAPMLALHLEPDGTFTLYRKNFPNVGEVILTVSAEGLLDDTYMYVEVKWVIHATAGSFELRVNTVPVMSFTGNTLGSGFPALWNTVHVLNHSAGGGTGDFYMRMCDFYLADLEPGGLGYVVDDFVGDAIIDMIRPDGIGAQSGWTPLAAPNWSEENEVPPDGDASYVETTPVGTRDTYTFEDIPQDPFGIQVVAYARKIGLGNTTIAPIIRQGGVDIDGVSQGVADPVEYFFLTWPYDANPATGVQWTAAEINAAEFGPLKTG